MLAQAISRSRQAFHLSKPCEILTVCQPSRPASTSIATTPHPHDLPPPTLNTPQTRAASSSSSSARWLTRSRTDSQSREAKLSGLKSRAAFKLLEIDAKHHLFRPGDTVVDLGYAPGSWSQVAASKVKAGGHGGGLEDVAGGRKVGRVVGIDVLPVQPPRGVSTIQGDFLSDGIREEVRRFVADPARGRARARPEFQTRTEEELEEEGRGVVDRAGLEDAGRGFESVDGVEAERKGRGRKVTQKEADVKEGRVVDVVLSDMCEPWPLVAATWVKSVSNPYRRMMNTSGMAFRDHAGSMDLCNAALTFAFDTLVTGGHFLCKFYAGSEDHALEMKLKKLFEKVHRIKPDASRKESKEAYFVCLRRRNGVERVEVLGEDEGG